VLDVYSLYTTHTQSLKGELSFLFTRSINSVQHAKTAGKGLLIATREVASQLAPNRKDRVSCVNQEQGRLALPLVALLSSPANILCQL
jgi:hypothetical protein